MSIDRFVRSSAYARHLAQFEVQPPSIVRGSSHSLGATNSGARPESASIFFTSLATFMAWP